MGRHRIPPLGYEKGGCVRTREWVASGVILATMLAAAATYGETRTPCYEAYLSSGLTQQQMSFEEFREFYGGGVCATSGREHE
jgi:hypothetical protein